MGDTGYDKNYLLITSTDELAEFCQRLSTGTAPIAFDIETGYHGPDREKFSIHPETAFVVGISFTDSPHWASYVPLGHDDYDNLDNRTVAELLWPILHSGRGVPHNASFELRHLARWFRQHLGEEVVGDGYFPVRSDTQIEAYLLGETQSFGLKYLTRIMFHRDGRPVEAKDLPARALELDKIAERAREEAKALHPEDDKDSKKQRTEAVRVARKRMEADFDGYSMTDLHELFEDLPKNRHKFLRFNILDPTDLRVRNYACEDSAWTLALHERNYHQVADTLLFKVEMAVVQECIPAMEDHGVVYDWIAMRRKAAELKEFRDRYNAEIMAELSDILDQPVAVNLASPPQVSKLLFEDLGLRTTVYTATTRDKDASERKMSTGKVALAGLVKQHPVVQKIRNWKEQTRLLGTYLEVYERKYSWADDGRAHPNHLSAVVVTGRFAVADPPYQQSPKTYHYDLAEAVLAHDEGREPEPGTCFRINFRDMITAPDDWYIVGFDLSQAELRAIAGEAKETELLRAFAEGRDVHTLTASLMLGVPIEQVTPKQRDIGKTLGFALLYGMSPKGLADRLGIPLDEAEELFASYFNVFNRIKTWVDKQVDFGRHHGYVVSRFGRRLPIWEYTSDKRWIQQKGDRACVNYPIQGSATGDYMKIAMVRAVRALKEHGLSDRVKMVMNVHDALEFYVHRSLHPEQVIAVLQDAVIYPVAGWPAMKADWHIGRRWGSPKEVGIAADGSMYFGDAPAPEVKPGTEFNEDGEEIEILPDLDAADIRDVMHLPSVDQLGAHLAPTGRRLLIEVDALPSEDAWDGFLNLVASTPGANVVVVRTPEGDLDLGEGKDMYSATGLSTVHTAQVSLFLGPARMSWDDTDMAPLADDLTL